MSFLVIKKFHLLHLMALGSLSLEPRSILSSQANPLYTHQEPLRVPEAARKATT